MPDTYKDLKEAKKIRDKAEGKYDKMLKDATFCTSEEDYIPAFGMSIPIGLATIDEIDSDSGEEIIRFRNDGRLPRKDIPRFIEWLEKLI